MAVALPTRQVLRKQLVLPMAVEENLLRTLAYDLDRHTPFRPDQVYFDATVIGRDLAKKTIRVDWAAALKTVVDGARRQAEEWGASVVAVVPGPSTSTPSRLNLLPEDARPRRMLWRQWQVWAPTALVASIALAVVLVPLIQKREYAIALLQQTEAERVQAEAAAGVRREFERLQGDYNYALAKKYAYPGTVQIIDDVTRVLPDDTWLTQFEMKTTVKGKEMQRDVFLRGESANGSKLISLLEDSKLVEQAALRSPTTKVQPGPGEVFDLGAQAQGYRAARAPKSLPALRRSRHPLAKSRLLLPSRLLPTLRRLLLACAADGIAPALALRLQPTLRPLQLPRRAVAPHPARSPEAAGTIDRAAVRTATAAPRPAGPPEADADGDAGAAAQAGTEPGVGARAAVRRRVSGARAAAGAVSAAASALQRSDRFRAGAPGSLPQHFGAGTRAAKSARRVARKAGPSLLSQEHRGESRRCRVAGSGPRGRREQRRPDHHSPDHGDARRWTLSPDRCQPAVVRDHRRTCRRSCTRSKRSSPTW